MDEVLSVVRSSLTAPPPSAVAAAGASTTGAELAPAGQPHALEIVDETPATAAHDDIDLDAPLWEHDTNEIQMDYMDGGEGVGIEGDLDVEDDDVCMQTVFMCVLSWLTDALLFRIEPTPRTERSCTNVKHGAHWTKPSDATLLLGD
jgi:hypothetical protein